MWQATSWNVRTVQLSRKVYIGIFIGTALFIGLVFLIIFVALRSAATYHPVFHFSRPRINHIQKSFLVDAYATTKESNAARTFSGGHIKVTRCGTLIVDAVFHTVNLKPGMVKTPEVTFDFSILSEVPMEKLKERCPDDQYVYEYGWSNSQFNY